MADHTLNIRFMKNLLILALLIAGNTAFAQDYCKQVKKEVTENNTSFNYESPYKEDSLPLIRVVRNYSTNPEADFDNFSLIFAIPCEFSDLLVAGAGGETEKEEQGVVIEFDDKTKLEDDITVTHNKKGDGTAMRVLYYPVNGDNIKQLTTKKIISFKLATAQSAVSAELATAIQKYVTCIRDVRKM